MKKTIYAILSAVLPAAFMSLPAAAQSADELLGQGREAFLDYRFDEAARLYAQAKRKAGRADEYFADKYDTYERQLSQARNFLERVEKIAVIDSISVPRDGFFRAYRLPVSAGSLGGAEALPAAGRDGVDYVFTNEGDDYKIWAEPDTTGYMHLVESSRLTDGKWSDPSPLDDSLAEEGDAIFPFMMADGVTLYFADNGENSIGGYDIMVATRDAADGSFLQPSNLGFPYNSPYDDYLLAVDELNGVGWWATDRNALDDMLTVYVFVTNDLRNNYSPDEDDVTAFARIEDYIATQPEDADYDELLETIRAIDPSAREKKPEFTLMASKGRIFHRYDELPDAASKAAVKRYMSALEELEQTESDLAAMRREYSRSQSSAVAARIRKAEAALEKQRADVASLRSAMYRTL